MPVDDLVRAAQSRGMTEKELTSLLEGRLIGFALTGNAPDYKELQRLTGVTPQFPHDRTQARYRELAQGGHYMNIVALANMSSIKPELAEADLQVLTEKAVDRGQWMTLYQYGSVTGIQPPTDEKHVQRVYAVLFRAGLGPEIEDIQNVTGVRPQIAPDVVLDMLQKGIDGNCLSGRILQLGMTYLRFPQLRVKLPRPGVLDLYDSISEDEDRARECDMIVELKKFTHVKPPRKIVQPLLERLALDGDYSKINATQEVLGMRPGRSLYAAILNNLQPAN